MSLSSLPNETIISILTCLAFQEDLAHISLSCRRFQNLAQPRLYTSYTQAGRKSFPRFIRTLAERPNLAKFLKSFNGYDTKYKDRGPRFRMRDLWSDETITKIRALLDPDTFEGMIFEKLFVQSNWDAFVALILLLCTNLESMTLRYVWRGVSPGNDHTFTEYMLHRFSRSTGEEDRPKIREVELYMADPSDFRDPPQFLTSVVPYINLPSLTNLRSYGVQHGYGYSTSPLDQNSVCSVTDLSFMNSSVMSHVIQQLLGNCQYLRRFKIEHIDQYALLDRYDIEAVRRGLIWSRHFLEELIIISPHTPLNMNGHNATAPFGSMKQFEKLKIVDMDVRWLVGLETFRVEELDPNFWTKEKSNYSAYRVRTFTASLPMTLESLTIRKCGRSILGCLPYLLIESGQIPPNLKLIHLQFAESEDIEDGYKNNWEAIAKERGIELIRETWDGVRHQGHPMDMSLSKL